MSDDLVNRLRREAGTLATMYAAADEIERLRAALQASRMQLAAKMAGKIALSDEKHMAILLAALENPHD